MSENGKVEINRLLTGIPGLDAVLGGGLPEYSFNIIGGAPGAGKTTLAHQFMFANATQERPALYFTVMGEPTLKMLRYQQQFNFFDPEKMEKEIRFINLSQVVLEQNLNAVMDRIANEIEQFSPGIVMVDSFRTLVRKVTSIPDAEIELQSFVQRLSLFLTSWQATTFLAGEYSEADMHDNPVFTVADGLLWLSQSVERNSVVRKLQVMKLRGQESMPGLHTFRITPSGLQVFPRTFGMANKAPHPTPDRRLSCGVPALDEMMGGGIPVGDSVLVSGPSGSGKSLLATQFISEGLKHGEPGVIAVFEEHPSEYLGRAAKLGIDLDASVANGKLRVLYLRPLDLSVDETLHEILKAVEETMAERVVIDSLSGFEMALAPAFREDFRESLYRMIGSLTGRGITVVSTVEIVEAFTDMRFSPHAISFLTDDIIRQRYIEIDAQLRRVLMVVKMRGGEHSKDIREYEINSTGLKLGKRLDGYRSITTGIPVKTECDDSS